MLLDAIVIVVVYVWIWLPSVLRLVASQSGAETMHLYIGVASTLRLCMFVINRIAEIENSLPQQKKLANFNEFYEIKKIRTKIR